MKRNSTIPSSPEKQILLATIELDASRPASSGPVPSRGIAYKAYRKAVKTKKGNRGWARARAYFPEK